MKQNYSDSDTFTIVKPLEHFHLLNIKVNDSIINEPLWLEKLNVSLTDTNSIRIPFWIENIFEGLIKTEIYKIKSEHRKRGGKRRLRLNI